MQHHVAIRTPLRIRFNNGQHLTEHSFVKNCELKFFVSSCRAILCTQIDRESTLACAVHDFNFLSSVLLQARFSATCFLSIRTFTCGFADKVVAPSWRYCTNYSKIQCVRVFVFEHTGFFCEGKWTHSTCEPIENAGNIQTNRMCWETCARLRNGLRTECIR
jgi:hypothetical protein